MALLSSANGYQGTPNGVGDHQADDIATTRLARPLCYSGSLEGYNYSELTPVIGREYTDLNIRDLLSDSERARKIQDLAVIVSQRGVAILRAQHNINPNDMRDLIEQLSSTAGSPQSSTLHVHPLTEEGSELGDQISVISSSKQQKGGGLTHQQSDSSRLASAGWHSDITFETVPSDYAMLKIHTLPATGGDTVS